MTRRTVGKEEVTFLLLSHSPTPSLDGRTDGNGVVFQAKNPLVINRRESRRRRAHVSSTKSRRGASRIAPDIDRQIESGLSVRPAEPTLDANEYDNERRKEADKAEREDITPVA